MTVVCVMTKTMLHYKNNVIDYPNNNSNYFSISTGSPGRKFPLTELYLVFLSLPFLPPSTQRGSFFGGQAPDVAQLHDGHLAAPAMRGKDF